ncbi:protein unc-93 homolog A-like isoform X2 [Dysidea avara]|uniref:protein unc-93 homolog A-like isoform X2 n=1 Tax=Dysidea avara TaxID=196820 RepID=UPI003319A99F
MEGDYNVLSTDEAVKSMDHFEINKVMDEYKNPVTHNNKFRYYYKNFVLFGFSVTFSFAAVYSSSNLLTTLAGKTLGFVSLAVFSFVGFTATCMSPALVRSFGMMRILVVANFSYVLFVAGQFYMSYFILIPAAVFYGLAASMYWISGITYVNKLAINYANEYNVSPEKMMSFANGIVMTSYAGGMLLGNVMSSSILLPSGLDEQSVAVGNESCNLEQNTDHIDPYNKYLMILRGVLLLCALIAFTIVILFLDHIKGENTKEHQLNSVCTKLLLELQNSGMELLNIVRKRGYILFCFPLSISSSMVEAFTIGSFPKEYVSACFGVHMVGYTTMVYALFTAISSFLTGKIYLAYFPRYVVAIFTTLITLSLAIFLVIWERQPSYVFVFTFIAVWGIVAGQWITLAPRLSYGDTFHQLSIHGIGTAMLRL